VAILRRYLSMNVYDKAHELARTLKNSPEVIEYKKATELINTNPANKKMVEDLRKKQFELYSYQMQGKEPPKAQLDAFNSLAGVISLNSDINAYLQSEMRFSRLWEDIMKILSDSIEIDSLL
jgi:cell fate (sporulation/competence/biofilm development) regulator YlbF (YheA/YmcA/DUF963 family)